jgi:hypothetical protein
MMAWSALLGQSTLLLVILNLVNPRFLLLWCCDYGLLWREHSIYINRVILRQYYIDRKFLVRKSSLCCTFFTEFVLFVFKGLERPWAVGGGERRGRGPARGQRAALETSDVPPRGRSARGAWGLPASLEHPSLAAPAPQHRPLPSAPRVGQEVPAPLVAAPPSSGGALGQGEGLRP